MTRAQRILVATIVACFAVGCSASDAPPAESPTTPVHEAPSGHGTFAQCLDEHGVPAPPGPAAGAPPGVDEQTWQQAMSECASLAPGPAG